jgi:hypothetical protein
MDFMFLIPVFWIYFYVGFYNRNQGSFDLKKKRKKKAWILGKAKSCVNWDKVGLTIFDMTCKSDMNPTKN